MAKQLTPIEAKLTLDASGVQTGASQATASVGAMTKALVGSKLITGAMGAAVSVAGAAIKGVTSIVKQSVSAYADYEQQVGGIETLFGAGGKSLEEYAASVGKSTAEVTGEYSGLMDAQNAVMKNANDAWKNQGLSANEYMAQVTSFAAALKQSTADSTEAADVANMAMTDMADNANKFGTDIGSIQNAYQGFAKQNYTMLDNLKLGYGGTKEEMQRLLTDAEKLTGIHYDITQLDDVYNAIHAVQTELGVTGTTADEATRTISGSASALSAAWQNTLVALGSGEGIDTAIQNLVTAFSTFAGNILPVIQTVLESAGTAIAELAPKVAEMLPGLVEAVLPNILSALTSLVTSIATMLGDQSIIDSIVQAGVTLFSALLDNAPAILVALGTGIINLVKGIATAIGEQFPAVKQAFTDLFGDIDLAESAKNIFETFKTGLSTAWESVKSWLTNLDIGGFIKNTFKGVGDFFSDLFGGGGDNTETPTETTPGATETPTGATTTGAATDSNVTMPTGVMTTNVAALSPVSPEVIDSWTAFAEAITAVNTAIQTLISILSGGGAGEAGAAGAAGEAGAAAASAGASAEGAEGGGGSLTDLLSAIQTVMTQVTASAVIMAATFSTTLPDAITTLCQALCMTSTDEEGNVKADKGNTLYTALGAVKGVFEDILSASRAICENWTGEFISASEAMRQEAGANEGVCQNLAAAASAAASEYNAMAAAIWAVIGALEVLNGYGGRARIAKALSNSETNSGDRGIHDLYYAEGGPVTGGRTIVVGEEGPELFTPSRSGYIIPNDELATGGNDTVINVVFSGDVIGDEKSISSYVKRAVKAGIRQEVLIG